MTHTAAIQMTSCANVTKNLAAAGHLIQQAAAAGAKLLVLPENFAFMGKHENDKLQIRETFGAGAIQNFLAEQAKKHNVWLVGGSIPLAADHSHKVYNTCLVYNSTGDVVARYDKIHLFDVQITPGTEVYEESKTVAPGNQIVIVDTPIGKMGLAICYDIRFPELFRIMLKQNVQIIAIPSAFTAKTGQAHWEILLRARAIENLCYVVGACQTGTHENGRQTYGHSLIIDPWGIVLAQLPDQPGFINAEIDLAKLQQIRAHFPSDKHQRLMSNIEPCLLT